MERLVYSSLANRFRGFYPVVIDVETGGLEPEKDALLEIAAFTLDYDEQKVFSVGEKFHAHITPYEGLRIQQESLEINGINPHHPFRFDVTESEALSEMFVFLKKKQKDAGCKRCVLIGHNAWFDLAFMNAAIKRNKLTKKNPFHGFTCFDTATMSAVAYGQTVLSQALKVAKIKFDQKESHSAVYDALKTAELFCKIVNGN